MSKTHATVVRHTYANGNPFWTVECNECQVVLNSGHHYLERNLEFANRLADEHDLAEHSPNSPCSVCGGPAPTSPDDSSHDECGLSEQELLLKAAKEMGAHDGENAGSWFFDGNTTLETYQAVAKGLEDGDPEVLDTLPTPDLSGEWADAPTAYDVVASICSQAGVDFDGLSDDGDAVYLDAYEEAYQEAALAEIERVLAVQLANRLADEHNDAEHRPHAPLPATPCSCSCHFHPKWGPEGLAHTEVCWDECSEPAGAMA